MAESRTKKSARNVFWGFDIKFCFKIHIYKHPWNGIPRPEWDFYGCVDIIIDG